MRVLSGHRGHGIAWVRLGVQGPGLVLKDTRQRGPIFSERHGHCRMVRLGPWLLRCLRSGGG